MQMPNCDLVAVLVSNRGHLSCKPFQLQTALAESAQHLQVSANAKTARTQIWSSVLGLSQWFYMLSDVLQHGLKLLFCFCRLPANAIASWDLIIAQCTETQ